MAYFTDTSATIWIDTTDTAWFGGSVLIRSNPLQTNTSLSATVAASFLIPSNPLQTTERLQGDVAVDFLIAAKVLRSSEQIYGKVGGTIFYQNSVWGILSADYAKVLGIDKISIYRIM